MKLTLDLTPRQVELLRNCTSDLGTSDLECVRLQLIIASAILDASPAPSRFKVGQRVRYTYTTDTGMMSGFLATIATLNPLVVEGANGTRYDATESQLSEV